MTTVPVRPIAGTPARAAAPAAPAGGGIGVNAIDPIKLLHKYKWHLIFATIFGVALGAGAHAVWMQTFPLFQAYETYEVTAQPTDPGLPGGVKTVDEDEMDLFKGTQVAYIKSLTLLEMAARDPNLARNAPKWSAKFMKDGVFDYASAALALEDSIDARIVPGTNYLQIAMVYWNRQEVLAIVSHVSKTYQQALLQNANLDSRNQIQVLEATKKEFENQIKQAQAQRLALVKDQNIDALDQKLAAVTQFIEQETNKLTEINVVLDGLRSQMSELEGQLRSPTGIQYSDQMRSEVEMDAIIQRIKAAVAELEAQQLSLQRRGIAPEHRDMMLLQARIDGYTAQLATERERLLRERFNATIDSLRKSVAQLVSQQAEATKRLQELKTEQAKLSQVNSEVDDIQFRIETLTKGMADAEQKLQGLKAVGDMSKTGRVLHREAARLPTEVYFPKWYIMIPAGVVLVVGCVGGIVFLREMLDQRVRGPADIALIPRTRLVGLIPEASEDPSAPKAMASAFTDAPGGVIAESFRQLRAPLLKRMAQAGHKSLLVIPGMPGSGATTVASNLAQACAATHQKVLLVDANFRRPGLHKVFGLPDGPGLGDVLGGRVTLDAAARPTAQEHLRVLTAGSAGERVLERLGTPAMDELLRVAGQSYDLIVLDTAPAIVSGDASALAARCDAAVLVVRAGNEKRGLVARVKNDLSDLKAEFLGVVVNAVRASAGGYFRRNIRAAHDYQNGKE